jgi:rod shape determining protein RodA
LGLVNLQPAELAKFVVTIVLARYFSKHADEMLKFRHLLLSGLLVLIPILLVMLEPDFGSAMMLGLIWIGMILFSRIRYWHLGVVFAALAAIAAGAWRFILRDYQKQRIKVFLDPSLDPLGRGYNVTQAKIAVGSGSWLGKGLGHGSQSQLNFLPEQHTDFIFAVLAEELGLIGCLFLLALFAFLFYRLARVAQSARDRFGMFLVVGVAVMILAQVLINIGMNVGLLPVAGIPLPFLSFGGSSIVTVLLGIGLALSVGRRSPHTQAMK